MIYEIQSHVATQLKEFFNQFDFIDKVVVFGSRARHDCTPKSDIDLCIYSLEMTDIEFSKLKFELDELPILYKLDIVHFEKVNRELQDNIERDGKLLFKNYLKFDDFFENIPAKKYQINKNEYLEIGEYPIVDQGQKFIVGYSTNKSKLFQIEKPIIIFGDHTRIIKYIDFNFIVGADGTKVLIPKNNKIDTKFAYYNLLNTNIENLGYSRHFKVLKEKSFYLPTLTKQKKIANTLDKASELITLRKESIKKLDELSKSIFIDMFGDPASNPKNWNMKKLGKITDVKTGKTPSRQEKRYWENGTEYWATTTEVNKKNIFDTEEKITKYAVEKCKLNIYEINTILIAMYGQGKTRGNVALLKIKSTINQAFGAILPSDDINYLFLFNLLKNSYLQIRSLGRGGNQENLNLDIVKNIEIILPPLELQTKFATIIEKIEEHKALYEKELKLLEDNFNSLLQKSFS